MASRKCARCNKRLGKYPEMCWWCHADLCGHCWDELGHCGHAEAEQANRDAAERVGEEYPRQPVCTYARIPVPPVVWESFKSGGPR